MPYAEAALAAAKSNSPSAQSGLPGLNERVALPAMRAAKAAATNAVTSGKMAEFASIARRLPAMPISRTLSGTLLVAGAATLWGVSGTAARVVMDAGLPPDRFAELRLTMAAVILLSWVALRRRQELRLTRREILAYACFGTLGLIGVQLFYFEAISRIPISISLVIEYSAPLLVALWVRFVWGRRLPWLVWVAIPVAIGGLVLVLGVGNDTGSLSWVGIAFSVGAALSYAYYSLHSESLMRVRSPVSVLGIGLAFGAVALGIALPWWSFPWSVLSVVATTAPVSAPTYLYVLFVVIVGTVIPFAMFLAGVRRVRADGATVTAMLEPIIAGAIAWSLLGQVLSPLQVIGGLGVLAAVTLAQLSRARFEAKA